MKFKTVEELDRAIQNYFAKCDPHETQALVETGRDAKGNMLYDTRNILTGQKPYTMTGLGLAVGLSRQALLEYSQRDGFGDSIAMAKQRCEEYWEGLLASPYSNGAKFNLINNYRGKHQDWADKQEIGGPGDTPLTQTIVRFVAEKDADVADAPADENSRD